jgi:hypothetical protein
VPLTGRPEFHHGAETNGSLSAAGLAGKRPAFRAGGMSIGVGQGIASLCEAA